jgi:phosphopantothenoylcysteine synthetase/decarboxylase
MSEKENKQRVLYLISCAAPRSRHVYSFIPLAQEAGWDVCVILTPQARKFIDAVLLEQITGHPVRSEFKHPDEPDVLPRADAIVVLAATFNTLNKWALGITDTLAVGLLCEYTGLKIPIIAFPATGEGLGANPAFFRSMRMLRRYGVHILYDPTKYPRSGCTPNEEILDVLQRLTAQS